MTAAEDAIKAHSTTRIWYLIIGGVIAFVMVLAGLFLTQRQLDLSAQGNMQDVKATEFTVDLKKEAFKLRSTYPGLVLIVCGTGLAVVLIRKRFYFKTQHKDEKNNIPGFTELES